MIDERRAVELEEFKRFGVDVYVLVDSEKPSADKEDLERIKFAKVCRDHFGQEKVLLTELRAVENYFTDSAIRSVKRSDKYKALEPFQRLDDAQDLKWSKNENWQIAAAMSVAEWSDTDIGKFLQRIKK